MAKRDREGKGSKAGRINEQVTATDTWVQSHWGLTETVGEHSSDVSHPKGQEVGVLIV